MMMHPSGGWPLLPLLMPAVMIALALVILSVARAASSPARPTGRKTGRRARRGSERDADENPLNVPRQRCVRGGIGLAEFERRVDVLVRRELTPERE